MAKSDARATAAAHDETLNRLNMSISKHASFLSSLKKQKNNNNNNNNSPRSGPPDAGSRSNKAGTAPSKSKPGFSSLASASPSCRPPQSRTTTAPSSGEKAARDDDDDDDDDNVNFGTMNSGVGYVPAGKDAADAARSAETRELSGRLLGKRSRGRERQEEAAMKKKKSRMRGDSSDEEEGRSAVGKSRKKKGAKGEEE